MTDLPPGIYPSDEANMADLSRYHLDLCSGIGGFALAAQWSGYTTIGFCEIDPWCQRVLVKNFPGVPMHDDLKTLEARHVRQWIADAEPRLRNDGAIAADAPAMQRASQQRHQPDRDDDESRTAGLDLITAGYPCQPFSLAGQRMGAEDDRHLWPFIAALVAELKPRRCLFENVYGHVSMGLDAVLSDLEAIGYTCGAVVVPACAIGAPHRRDRVWILADSRGERRQQVAGSAYGDEAAHEGRATQHDYFAECDGEGGGPGDVADADRTGQQEQRGGVADETKHAPTERDCGREFIGGMGGAPDGVSRWVARSGWRVGPDVIDPWALDWESGCPRTTTREPGRVKKLRGLGNAVVPGVAYEILRAWDGEEDGRV